jgi:hypothetical protein
VRAAGMHLTKVSSSKRLQSILGLLAMRGDVGATTQELHTVSGSLNPATEISCIRAQGYKITARYQGRTETNAKIFRYRLSQSTPVDPTLL